MVNRIRRVCPHRFGVCPHRFVLRVIGFELIYDSYGGGSQEVVSVFQGSLDIQIVAACYGRPATRSFGGSCAVRASGWRWLPGGARLVLSLILNGRETGCRKEAIA